MNIGIFFRREPFIDRSLGPFYIDHPQFLNYIGEVIDEGRAQGHNVYIICKKRSYKEGKTFFYYWEKTEKVGWFKLAEQTIDIDVIFDKGYFRLSAPIPIMNVPALASLGRNKIAQNELFKSLQPQTYNKTTDDLGILNISDIKINTDLVVIKPNDKNGGRDIQILKPAEVAGLKLEQKQTYVVQEFIDSFAGIPNITESTHDVRFYVLNGNPVAASVRTPAKGKLISNTNLGGKIKVIDPKLLLSNELKGLLSSVDKPLSDFGARFYSADFMLGKNGWKLIEINDRPGVLARFQNEEVVANFQKELIKCIVGAATNEINKNALRG